MKPGFDDGQAQFTADHQLHINEVQTMNRSTLRDEDGQYSDWIELYNAGTKPLDLTGFGLSDRETEPFLWQFPSLTLEPQSYLVVFASGKDRRDPAKNLHTNFRLSISGESLLTAPTAKSRFLVTAGWKAVCLPAVILTVPAAGIFLCSHPPVPVTAAPR